MTRQFRGREASPLPRLYVTDRAAEANVRGSSTGQGPEAVNRDQRVMYPSARILRAVSSSSESRARVGREPTAANVCL